MTGCAFCDAQNVKSQLFFLGWLKSLPTKMVVEPNLKMNDTHIEIYQIENGETEISVKLENETVWLSLNQITELFQRDKSVISRHINNIFKENELTRNSVVAKNATTAKDGKIYQVDYFNLDVIISVGYRIKSKRGTQFRIWSNKILKDYLVKGYVINEKRLLQQNKRLLELQKSVEILGNVLNYKELSNIWR